MNSVPPATRHLPGLLLAFALLLATSLAAAAPPAQAPAATADNPQAREAWMAGYLKFEEAQKAEAGNNQVLALDLYRDALNTFNQVKARFPGWNQSLLDYRINFCRERCRRLEAAVTAKNVDLTKAELVTLSRTQQEQLKALAGENSELKKKLDLLGQSLERARAEAAAALAGQTQLPQLLEENKTLKAQLQAGAEREKTLAADNARLRTDTGLKAKADQLQQQLDATRARQAALEQNATAQTTAVQTLKDQLREVSLERERLQHDLTRLQEKRGEDSGQTAGLQARLAAQEEKVRELEATRTALAAERQGAEKLAADALAQIKAQNDELARLRPLEAQLAARLAELQRAQADLKAAEAKLATAGEGADGPLQTELAALKPRLATAEQALATARETLAESQARGQTLQDQNALAARELAARDNALATAQRQTADLTRERDRLNGALDALQKRSNALAAQVNALESERNRAATTGQTQQTQIAALEKRAGDAEATLAALTARHDELTRLSRRQEEQLASHGKGIEARDTRLREQDAQLADLRARLVSQQDLAAALDGLKTAAAEAKALAAAAEQRAGALEARLVASERDLASARAALATERAATLPAGEVRTQYETALRDLEREREKVRVLEAQLGAAAPATARSPAPPPAADDPQSRQTRQQLAILEIKLTDRERELQVLRDELAKERLSRSAADDPLLDELRTLNRELDRERDKVKQLEQALVRQAGTAGVLPVVPGMPAAAAPTVAAPSKADLALGFLQTAAGAEQQGKTEAAVWNYRKALEYEPDSKLALKRLGLIAAGTGDDEGAEDYLRRAFRSDPDDVDVLLPLGFALVRRGQTDLALSMLARAAALRPDDANVHRAYGVACSSLGWLDAAEAQLQRAFAVNPQDGEAAFNLAVLLAARKPARFAEARTWYTKARALGVAADPGLDKLFAQEDTKTP